MKKNIDNKTGFRNLLGLMIVLCSLSACITSGVKPVQSPRLLNVTEYVLGTGDQIKVNVFGDETLSGEFTVDTTGNISMPLIQDIKAAGLTAEQLQDNISEKLYPKYLNDPKVSVQIVQYGDVFVLGEVRLPGKYPYSPNMTVLQAAAVAGGYTYRADESGATVSRLINGKVEKFDITEDNMVSPGDTIYVGRRWF